MQVSFKLRILIADDHDIVRRGLRAFLSSRPGWEVCAEAATGREAIAMAELHRPDIVVMDIAMPELNGLEAARQIRRIVPKPEIVFLSVYYTDELVREVLATGAHSYILKSDADKELFLAVEALANGRSFFTSRAEQIIIDDAHKKGSATQPLVRKRLTLRQQEIVQKLVEGKSSKEVAEALGISVKTAETHRANIMRKLDLHSVSELVRYAIRNHMLEP